MKTRALWAAFGMAMFLFSPQVACRSAAPTMAPTVRKSIVESKIVAKYRPLVEGEWIYRKPVDGVWHEVRFRLSQSSRPTFLEEFSFIESAQACNETLLLKTASACTHFWSMPLDVEILESPDNVPVPAIERMGMLAIYNSHDTANLLIRFGRTVVSGDLRDDGYVKVAGRGTLERADHPK